MFEKEKKSFVIYCTARSGSYLLVEYLNCFPNIKCFGELFKTNSLELGYDKRKTNFTVSTRDEKPLMFLKHTLNFYPRKSTGFKIFPVHNEKVVNTLISHSSFKKVVLKRNPIEVYLSLINARASGVWVQRKDTDVIAKIKFVDADFESLKVKFDSYYAMLDTTLAENNQEAIFLTYADVTQKDKVFDVARFLGEVDLSVDLTSSMTKQIKDYKLILENYNETISYLEKNHKELFETSSLNKG